MIRIKSERILLVAPNVFSVQLLARNKKIKHVTVVDRVFPAIFELAPNLIVFDYDFVSADIEKMVRRLRVNAHYDKVTICCYKNKPNLKTDALLLALGVDHMIYKEELTNPNRSVINHIRSILDSTMTELLLSASF